MSTAIPVVVLQLCLFNFSKRKNCLESLFNQFPGSPANASDVVSLAYSMWVCSSNKLPGEPPATGPGVTLWNRTAVKSKAVSRGKDLEQCFLQGSAGSGDTHETEGHGEGTSVGFVFNPRPDSSTSDHRPVSFFFNPHLTMPTTVVKSGSGQLKHANAGGLADPDSLAWHSYSSAPWFPSLGQTVFWATVFSSQDSFEYDLAIEKIKLGFPSFKTDRVLTR